MQTGIRAKGEQSTQEEMLCIWEGKPPSHSVDPPLALFPYSGILFPLMAIPFALFLLLSVSALAYDFPNLTYRTCYDGTTCRFGTPNVHPFFGESIPTARKDG